MMVALSAANGFTLITGASTGIGRVFVAESLTSMTRGSLSIELDSYVVLLGVFAPFAPLR